MATKIEVNKVYKCSSPTIAAASVHVIGGPVSLVGSNVTNLTDDGSAKLISPAFSDLVATGDDELSDGIHLLSGTPEWFGFTGSESAEIWVKMGVDIRIAPTDA